MSTTPFTTIRQVAEAVAREIGVAAPQHAQDYPCFYDKTLGHFGMGHKGAPRGGQRRYWVRLDAGREFHGLKADLLEWAALHLNHAEEAA